MVDELDNTEEQIEFVLETTVKQVSADAKKFDPGMAGECELCGEEFPRVVQVVKDDRYIYACGRCRDRHGIK